MNPIPNDVRRLMGAITGLCLVATTGPAAGAEDADLGGWPPPSEASGPGLGTATRVTSPGLMNGARSTAAEGPGTAPAPAQAAASAPAPVVRTPSAQVARSIHTAATSMPAAPPSAAAPTVPPCATAHVKMASGAPPVARPTSATTLHEQAVGTAPPPVAFPGLASSVLLVSAGGVLGAAATRATTRRKRPDEAENERSTGPVEATGHLAREPEPKGIEGSFLNASPGNAASEGTTSAPTATRSSATTPEPMAIEASPVRRVQIDQLAGIAERWCGLDEPLPELFAELNLPAKLGTLFGPRAGMVSVTGPVRSRNEDAALLLGLDNGCTLLMAADGMGGHPDGHLASRLALLGACVGLREALNRPTMVDSKRVLLHAFSRARWTLRRATRAGRLKPGAGTTLIATLVESDHYVTTYLGDGGAFVRRADGSVEALMVVQKEQSNRLDRYLSADSPASWRPQISRVARRRQDTLAVGSDGVVDRVDIQTVLSWLASNVATKGLSMPQAVQQLLANFARLQADDGEPIADDNMTLLAVRMR